MKAWILLPPACVIAIRKVAYLEKKWRREHVNNVRIQCRSVTGESLLPLLGASATSKGRVVLPAPATNGLQGPACRLQAAEHCMAE